MANKNLTTFRQKGARLDEAARFAMGDGRRIDLARATKLYRAESKAGTGEASFNLATMYARGEGVKESWSAALALFRLAEQQGYPDASLVLGDLRLQGARYVRKDAKGAIVHFAIAALRGDIRGLRSLADAIDISSKLSASRVASALRQASKLAHDAALLRSFQNRTRAAPRAPRLTIRR